MALGRKTPGPSFSPAIWKVVGDRAAVAIPRAPTEGPWVAYMIAQGVPMALLGYGRTAKATSVIVRPADGCGTHIV